MLFLTARPELYPYLSAEMVAPHVVDTGDVAAICRLLAQQGDVVGVMSTSEYFIETAAQVAARLSLPGPDVEGVRNCRDKGRLARALERVGVSAPETFQVDSPALLEQLAPQLKFPVVVKPIFGSGSVGVRLVATAAELLAVGRKMLSEPRNERGIAVPPDILIQAFLPGEEFSVEVFSTGGSDHVVGITKKHLGAAPFFVEMGHDFPRASARRPGARCNRW
ncbi:ATP-grasp domain-containing protein [Nannocystis pusilla]|uniref:ATP-grasp domain-containing protein n=1 Tax=Nannocystis pusilla TaxID=889268 RepID=UPI003B7F7B35